MTSQEARVNQKESDRVAHSYNLSTLGGIVSSKPAQDKTLPYNKHTLKNLNPKKVSNKEEVIGRNILNQEVSRNQNNPLHANDTVLHKFM